MDLKTIRFRLPTDKRDAIDEIAKALDRDRTYVLNQAVDAYLDVNQWQAEHIKEGLRQADAGQFASSREVATAFARWRERGFTGLV